MFSTPGKSVCINQFYLPFVTGALEVLAIDDYWEDPASVVPQIELLIAKLNEIADDCGAPSTPYCAAYDFADSSHSDVWEGITGTNGEPAPSYSGGLGGWLQGSVSQAPGVSQICAMHFHSDTPIFLDFMDICWNIIDHSPGVADSLGVLCPDTDADCNSGFVLTPSKAPDFNGCTTTASLGVTGTDFVIRVQLDASGPGVTASGDILITGISFFGTGESPIGGSPCV